MEKLRKWFDTISNGLMEALVTGLDFWAREPKGAIITLMVGIFIGWLFL